MAVDKVNSNGLLHSLGSSNLTQDVATANQGDANWFSAAMQSQGNGNQNVNVAERIVNSLSQSSGELKKLSDDADRALKKAVRTADPKDILQANRSLSSFYLESMLTTKLVNKGAQAVEKLTSLQ